MIPSKAINKAISFLNIAYNMVKDIEANIPAEHVAYYIRNAVNSFGSKKNILFHMHLPQDGDEAVFFLIQAKTTFIDGIYDANQMAEKMGSINWKDHDPENTIGKAMTAIDCINEALRWWKEKHPVLDCRD